MTSDNPATEPENPAAETARPATGTESPTIQTDSSVAEPRIPVPETAVPDEEEPASRCHHCDRPFASAALRDLHVGEIHGDVAADGEREAYESALDDERDALFLYQLKVTVVLGLTYSSSALVLLFVLG